MTDKAQSGSEDRDEKDRREKVTEAGPADHGNSGGMATRENAPEIAEGSADRGSKGADRGK